MTESRALYADAMVSLFNNEEIAFDRRELEDESVFILTFGIDNAPGMIVRFIIDNSCSAKLRCRLFRNIPKEKSREVIRMLNQINTQYRFICFCLDDEGGLYATYDFNLHGECNEAAAFSKEMIMLLLNIADDAIPTIAKALWN